MKKTIIAAALLLSVAFISATSGDRTKQFSDLAYAPTAHYDTVPSDTTKDTTKPGFGLLSYNVKDTVPEDTTKKDTTASMLAFNIVRDTVPEDTTKKDTTASMLAYNIIRDTVPTDTSKKDTSSFQYMALVR